MKLLHDKRLRRVQWKDLTALSLYEIFVENTLSIPWLLVSWVLAYYHWYLFALPFSFIFFLTGLRQSHNAFHHTLGTSRSITTLTLFVNSVLMMASMHAVKYNHLRHHKYCLEEGDVEGRCAKMSAWKAILHGPIFIAEQHSMALRSKKKQTMINTLIEICLVLVTVTIVFLSPVGFLKYHFIAMAAGELLTAFFAVWTVHHDCDEEVFARSLHVSWKNKLTFNMFYHLEHHLFPGVPTIKLAELSRRIQKELPDIAVREVF